MSKRIWVDRSRYETGQRCLRARFLEYHFGETGIVTARKNLALCVGGSVHEGLAELLRGGQALVDSTAPIDILAGEGWDGLEERAVAVALADFASYQNALDAPDSEMAGMATLPRDAPARNEFDEYLWKEQSALVEAMVRAYSRRRLRPLLNEFEVLEVEREGQWMLSDNDGDEERDEIWFMSRPDALLRSRESNQLYLQSYKTTGAWDVRKARDAEHDMQGMSEGIEVERRLGEWWKRLDGYGNPHPATHFEPPPNRAMLAYLRSCDAPPRILAVRYEYLLKGERWKDRDLSERFGVEMRSQKSHLIRKYVAVSVPAKGAAGYSVGDECWSWDFIRDDGRDSNLAWQNWKSRGVWDEPGGVKKWIDKLSDAAERMSGEDSTMGLEPRLLGYACDAQRVGVTRDHPLDSVFIPPVIVYRQEDEVRDMVEQMEAAERRIAEGVAAVEGAEDEGEARHLLNVHFPQTRRACSYPTLCGYAKLCYGGEDIRRDPLGSGQYVVRIANHPQENDAKG